MRKWVDLIGETFSVIFDGVRPNTDENRAARKRESMDEARSAAAAKAATARLRADLDELKK